MREMEWFDESNNINETAVWNDVYGDDMVDYAGSYGGLQGPGYELQFYPSCDLLYSLMEFNSYSEFLMIDSGFDKECVDPATSTYTAEEIDEMEQVAEKIFNVYCYRYDFKSACNAFAQDMLFMQLSSLGWENTMSTYG